MTGVFKEAEVAKDGAMVISTVVDFKAGLLSAKAFKVCSSLAKSKGAKGRLALTGKSYKKPLPDFTSSDTSAMAKWANRTLRIIKRRN